MKIKDYAQVSGPISLSDKLIGTEVGGAIPFATKNFTLQQLLDLFVENFPSSLIPPFPVLEGTYAELQGLIDLNLLNPGTYFLITNYQTIYDQPDYEANGTPKTEVTTLSGPTEPLLVLAISTNEIADNAYMLSAPDDIIHYDHTFTVTEVNGTPAKGRITRRTDTNNNTTGYDHTVVLFKRYESSPSSGIFNQYKDNGGSFIEVPTFGVDCENMQLLDSRTDVGFDDPIFILPNSVFGDNCESVTTAGDFYNNTIGELAYGITFGHWCNSNIIGSGFVNNHILNEFSFNTIGNGFLDNTILNYFQNNIIADDFLSNNIGNGFGQGNANTIGSGFAFNIIENGFANNTIGISFQQNTIANFFISNIVTDNFISNKIANNFSENTIANYFNSNIIGNSFYNNIIGINFTNNTIGDGFGLDIPNTIGTYFGNNTIGNDFNANVISNYFNNNSIGNTFYGNIVATGFIQNTILNFFGNSGSNYIGTNFGYNTIGNGFYSNELGNYFQNNNIGNDVVGMITNDYFNSNNINSNCVNNTDFGSATHVYAAFTTNISLNSTGTVSVLSYINASNVSVNTSATA